MLQPQRKAGKNESYRDGFESGAENQFVNNHARRFEPQMSLTFSSSIETCTKGQDPASSLQRMPREGGERYEIQSDTELRVLLNGSVFLTKLFGRRNAYASCTIEVVDENAPREIHKGTIFSRNPGYIEQIDNVVVTQNGLKVCFRSWGRAHWVEFSFRPEA